jgi:hypothetical protein
MKMFRLIPLLTLTALAALAACADPVTAPVVQADAQSAAASQEGTGFLGGGTRYEP